MSGSDFLFAPLLSLLVLAGMLRAAPLHAAPVAKNEVDGGLASRYFGSIKLPAASFTDLGKRRQNILWITVCSLRPDHLGVYGYDKNTSPNIDSWAQDAFVFYNHHSNAPWTRPATASMLTGLYPSGHRTQTDRSALPKSVTTLAQTLREQGYHTAAIIGNGNAGRITKLDRGFDDYADTVNRWKGLPKAQDIFGEAQRWLKKHKSDDKPWLLLLFFVDVHDPYHAPKSFERAWLKGYKGKLVRSPHWEHNPGYTKAQQRATVALYDAAINAYDLQFGRFMKKFQALGLNDKSTVIFTADHGEGFGEHGYFLHAHHLLDEFIRIPLIMKTPAWKGHGSVFNFTQSVDFAPTLLGLAGAPSRPEWVGQDLSRALARPVDRRRIGLSEFNEFGIHRTAILDLDSKLILQSPANKKEYLARIPRMSLLPSVNFKQEVLRVFDRQADAREQHAQRFSPVVVSSLSPKSQQLVQILRDYLQQAPAASDNIDPKSVPKEVIDDLRSLGYVQ